MLTPEQITEIVTHHIVWSHSKSGGHGGQNVNKRETKAEGYFHLEPCPMLSPDQKNWLRTTYHNHYNHHDATIRLTCQEERTLSANKKKLEEHFRLLFELCQKEDIYTYLHRHGHHHHHG